MAARHQCTRDATQWPGGFSCCMEQSRLTHQLHFRRSPATFYAPTTHRPPPARPSTSPPPTLHKPPKTPMPLGPDGECSFRASRALQNPRCHSRGSGNLCFCARRGSRFDAASCHSSVALMAFTPQIAPPERFGRPCGRGEVSQFIYRHRTQIILASLMHGRRAPRRPLREPRKFEQALATNRRQRPRIATRTRL